MGVRVAGGNRLFDESFGESAFRLLTISHADGVASSGINTWLDGVSLAQDTPNTTLTDPNVLNTGNSGIVIGNGSSTPVPFNGRISEFIVYG